jgi:hypothetical protein
MHYPGCTRAHKHGAAGNFVGSRPRRNPSDADIERLIAHHRRLSRDAEAAAQRLVGKPGTRDRVHRLLLKAADHSIKVQKLARQLG